MRFSVVRYGNVMGSARLGDPVLPRALRRVGVLPITDERMTRFMITLEEGVDFVLSCMDRMRGGEIFVPKIPSYRILDVAAAVAPTAEIKFVGIRPGEKIARADDHEHRLAQHGRVRRLLRHPAVGTRLEHGRVQGIQWTAAGETVRTRLQLRQRERTSRSSLSTSCGS